MKRSFFRRYGPLIPLLGVVVALVAVFTYLAGWSGIDRGDDRALPAPSTNPPPLPGTPVAPFYQLDPAIVAYLDGGQPAYGAIPLDALGLDVPPIGAYLPRTGNTGFTLPEPTVPPTPLVYPTVTPIPVSTTSPTPLPTLPPTAAPTDIPAPTAVAAVSANTQCAPEGRPIGGILSQRFHAYHPGIDLAVSLGTPVRTTHSGTVIFSGWSDIGYGNLVIVQSGAFITYYAHNTTLNVSSGDYVAKGSIVALSGSTGNSTGPHVHYEIRINDVPVDPLSFADRGYGTC